ncbi:hypothetical protein F0562_032093 [Nyssa sinensis]|uniref:Uncharacterized protein n=1 Tax=Nyssa sinensis TaxID=561372 RepID=A0A5J5AWF0_9ASTE|nr:hypothetical protein F0562_032093 [Nyssa sinensis]
MTRWVLIRFTWQKRITTGGSYLHWIDGLYCIRRFLLIFNLGGEFRLRGIGRDAICVIKESSIARGTDFHCFKHLDIIIGWPLSILSETCRLNGSSGGEIELWLRANEPCGEPPIWLAMRLTTSGDAFGISLMPKVDGSSSPLEIKWVSLVHSAEAGRVMGSPAPIETSTEWTPAALAKDRIAGLKAEFVARVSPCMRRDAAAT